MNATDAEKRLKLAGYETKWKFDANGVANCLCVYNAQGVVVAALDIENGMVDDLQMNILLASGTRRRMRKRK